MGLDISHDAFHGAYSTFNRFRQIVAKAMGGSHPPHDDPALDYGRWYCSDDFQPDSHPGLYELLNHSDCDGSIAPDMCAEVANELEALLPKIEKLDNGGGGHIEREGGYAAVTRQFIAGCRAAHEAGESLEFD